MSASPSLPTPDLLLLGRHNIRVLAALTLGPGLTADPPTVDLSGATGESAVILAIEGVSAELARRLRRWVTESGGGVESDFPGQNGTRSFLLSLTRSKLCAHLASLRAHSDTGSALAGAIDHAWSSYRAALDVRRATRVMGVVNVTPDSFNPVGRFPDPGAAAEHGLRLVAEGADILDVGGESTRPGADPVSAEEELARVLPVVRRLARETSVPISVDTTKAEVAEPCLEAGARWVNDVSALTFDPTLASAAARACATLVLMHMRGTPGTMQRDPVYDDVVADTMRFLRKRVAAAVESGVPLANLVIDPGIGFGKTVGHNLEILRRLREYTSIGLPILVGTSRKSMIGHVLGGLPPEERLEGTAATVAAAILNGAAIVRVHDVQAMRRVARMTDAIRQGAGWEK